MNHYKLRGCSSHNLSVDFRLSEKKKIQLTISFGLGEKNFSSSMEKLRKFAYQLISNIDWNCYSQKTHYSTETTKRFDGIETATGWIESSHPRPKLRPPLALTTTLKSLAHTPTTTLSFLFKASSKSQPSAGEISSSKLPALTTAGTPTTVVALT